MGSAKAENTIEHRESLQERSGLLSAKEAERELHAMKKSWVYQILKTRSNKFFASIVIIMITFRFEPVVCEGCRKIIILKKWKPSKALGDTLPPYLQITGRIKK